MEKYRSLRPGYTARLDTLQALVLGCKLPLLDDWNRERAEAAAFYDVALAGVGDLQLPPERRGARRSGICTSYGAHDAMNSWLTSLTKASPRGAITPSLRTSPTPSATSPAAVGSFPIAERLADELLSLPLFPGIEPEQLETVVEAIRAFFGDG